MTRSLLTRKRSAALVAGAFGLSAFIAGRRTSLGWDEIVYFSQVSTPTPDAFFGPHRARGMSYLLAPLAQLTTSPAVIRFALAILATAALWLIIVAWKPVAPLSVRLVAVGIFASLWVSRYYAPRAMPNLWVALAGSIALAEFLRVTRQRTTLNVALLTGGIVLATLMRPADAMMIAIPIGVAALFRRDAVAASAVALGFGVGIAQWVVEAYHRFGDPLNRIQLASKTLRHGTFHPGFIYQVKALNGPALCEPCDGGWSLPFVSLWFPLFIGAVALGVRVAWRAGRRLEAVLPLACGVSVASTYLATVDFGAPRFLLPAFALLAWPAAEGVLAVWRMTNGRRVVLAVAVAHVAAQSYVLGNLNGKSLRDSRNYQASAALLRARGITPPCVVTGEFAIPMAFHLGCRSEQTRGNNRSISPKDLRALAERYPTAVLDWNNGGRHDFAASWEPIVLPFDSGFTGEGGAGSLVAYVSPEPRR